MGAPVSLPVSFLPLSVMPESSMPESAPPGPHTLFVHVSPALHVMFAKHGPPLVPASGPLEHPLHMAAPTNKQTADVARMDFRDMVPLFPQRLPSRRCSQTSAALGQQGAAFLQGCDLGGVERERF